MRGALRVDPGDAVPIWRQIEEGMRRRVLSGAMAPGTLVPSVRELARELRVNPATVARAYQRLVEGGVLQVRRGDGTYVAEALPSGPGERLGAELHEAALRYASLAMSAGVDLEGAHGALDGAWKDLQEGKA